MRWLLFLFLVGCSQKSTDGYNFGTKEYEKTNRPIEFVILTKETFDITVKQYVKETPGEVVQAFSRIRDDKCIVYIKDAAWDYEPEFIGHEIAHCIWGRWHE